MLVSEFLTNLKRRGQIQSASTVLSDADFVAMANDEVKSVIAPKIISLRDNYFSCIKEYAVSRRLRLPPKCMGGRIQSIAVVNGTEQYQLQQMPNTDKSTSARRGFYVSQGEIILTGELPTGTLKVTYPCRLPVMSPTTLSTILVAAVNASSLTFASSPGVATGLMVIRKDAPYRAITPNLTTDATTTATDADCSDYTRYQVGDILVGGSTPGMTNYVPLQEQLCDWLLQRTYMRVLQTQGHVQQLQAAGAKLQDIEKDVMAFLSPRVQNSPKVIFGMQTAGWRDL